MANNKREVLDIDDDFKLDLDEFNLDAFDELSDFDYDSQTTEKKPGSLRDEIIPTLKSAAIGAYEDTKIKDILKKVLPPTYGEIIDTGDEIYQSSVDLYRYTANQLRSQTNQLKYVSERAISTALQSRIPESAKARLRDIEEKLRKEREERESAIFDSYSYQESEEERETNQINATLNEIFEAQKLETLMRDRRAEAREDIKNEIDVKRFKINMDVLKDIRDNVSAMQQYQTSIGIQYQRKSLELQFRQYKTQIKSLDELKRMNLNIKQELEGIRQNTALPDHIKLHLSADGRAKWANKFASKTGQMLFGSESYLKRFVKNNKDWAHKKVAEVSETLDLGFGGLLQGLETAYSFGENINPIEMIAQQLLNRIIGMGVEKIKDKVKVNDKVDRFGNRLDIGITNLDALTKEWAQNQGAFDINNYKELDGSINYTKLFADLGGHDPEEFKNNSGLRKLAILANNPTMLGKNSFDKLGKPALAQLLINATNTDVEMERDNIANLREPGIITKHFTKSVIEIIPGYLARILREIRVMRTGNENEDLLVFNPIKNTFDSHKGIVKDIQNSVLTEGMLNRRKDKMYSIFNDVDMNKDFTDEEKEKLTAFLVMKNLDRNRVLDDKFLSDDDNYKDMYDDKLAKKAAAIMRNYFAQPKNDTGDLTNQLNRKLRDVRDHIVDPARALQDWQDLGYGDYLANLGLVEEDKYNKRRTNNATLFRWFANGAPDTPDKLNIGGTELEGLLRSQGHKNIRQGGFSRGGFTGHGPKQGIAGLAHMGEFLFDQDSVKKLGLDNLRKLQDYAKALPDNADKTGFKLNLPNLSGMSGFKPSGVNLGGIGNQLGGLSNGFGSLANGFTRPKMSIPKLSKPDPVGMGVDLFNKGVDFVAGDNPYSNLLYLAPGIGLGTKLAAKGIQHSRGVDWGEQLDNLKKGLKGDGGPKKPIGERWSDFRDGVSSGDLKNRGIGFMNDAFHTTKDHGLGQLKRATGVDFGNLSDSEEMKNLGKFAFNQSLGKFAPVGNALRHTPWGQQLENAGIKYIDDNKDKWIGYANNGLGYVSNRMPKSLPKFNMPSINMPNIPNINMPNIDLSGARKIIPENIKVPPDLKVKLGDVKDKYGNVIASVNDLELGKLIDEKGKALKSWDDVKGNVYDLAGNIKLTPADLHEYYLNKTDAAGTTVEKFLDNVRGNMKTRYDDWVKNTTLGDYINTLRKPGGILAFTKTRALFKPLGNMGQQAFERVAATDIYIKGKGEEPVMLKTKMRRGQYIDVNTKKPVYTVADITGPVVDLDGEMVLTKEDYEAGLVNRNGKTLQVKWLTGVQGTMGLYYDSIEQFRKRGFNFWTTSHAIRNLWKAQIRGIMLPFKFAKEMRNFKIRTLMRWGKNNTISRALYNYFKPEEKLAPVMESIKGQDGQIDPARAMAAQVAQGVNIQNLLSRIMGNTQVSAEVQMSDRMDTNDREKKEEKEKARAEAEARHKAKFDRDGDGDVDGSVKDLRQKQEDEEKEKQGKTPKDGKDDGSIMKILKSLNGLSMGMWGSILGGAAGLLGKGGAALMGALGGAGLGGMIGKLKGGGAGMLKFLKGKGGKLGLLAAVLYMLFGGDDEKEKSVMGVDGGEQTRVNPYTGETLQNTGGFAEETPEEKAKRDGFGLGDAAFYGGGLAATGLGGYLMKSKTGALGPLKMVKGVPVVGSIITAGISAYQGYNAYKANDWKGVAEAAVGGAGALGGMAGGAALGFMLGGPIGAIIGGVAGSIAGEAAMGAAGGWLYSLGRKVTRRDLTDISRLRILQYGFHYDDKYSNILVDLEDMLFPFVINNQHGVPTFKTGFNEERVMEMFSIDITDKEALQRFNTWFNTRFRTNFLTFVAYLKKILPGASDVNEVETLTNEQMLELLRITRLTEMRYPEVQSPFISGYPTDVNGSDVTSEFDEVIAELEAGTRKRVENVTKEAKQSQGGATQKEMNSPENVNMSFTDIVWNAGKKTLGHVHDLAFKGVLRTHGENASKWLGQVFGDKQSRWSDKFFEHNKPIDALTALRLRTYGIIELDSDMVKVLLKLENDVFKLLTGSGENLTFTKNIKEFYHDNYHDELTAFLSREISTKNTAAKSINWFTARFLPVAINFYKEAKRLTNGADNFYDAVDAMHPTKRMLLADALLATTSGELNGQSIFHFMVVPWGGRAANKNDCMASYQTLKKESDAAPMKEEVKADAQNQKYKDDESKANSLVDKMKEKIDGLKEKASEVWKSVTDTVKGTWEAATDKVDELGRSAFNAVGLGEHYDSAKEIASNAISNTPLAKMSEVGSGIADSIGDMVFPGKPADVGSIPKPTGTNWQGVKGTIVAAANMVGVDPGLAAAMAAIESDFNYTVKAKTSSATGMYQFIDSTWVATTKKYGKKYGITPSTSRRDPVANTIMGMEFLKENYEGLKRTGLSVLPGDLYLAHFMGLGGARQMMRADQNAIAAKIFPKQAAANKGIFYDKNGRARTIAEVRQELNNRLLSRHKQHKIDVPIGSGSLVGKGKSNANSADQFTKTQQERTNDAIKAASGSVDSGVPNTNGKDTSTTGKKEVDPVVAAKIAGQSQSIGARMTQDGGATSGASFLAQQMDKAKSGGASAGTTAAPPAGTATKSILGAAAAKSPTAASNNTSTGGGGVDPTSKSIANSSIKAVKAAQIATRRAHAKSIGRCAQYVREALEMAGFKKVVRGNAHAWLDGRLERLGFAVIPNNTPSLIGDIKVFDRVPSAGAHWGHIQIFNGKIWVSCFRQRTPYVRAIYRTSRHKTYRHNELLKGDFKNLQNHDYEVEDQKDAGKDTGPSSGSQAAQLGAQGPSTQVASNQVTQPQSVENQMQGMSDVDKLKHALNAPVQQQHQQSMYGFNANSFKSQTPMQNTQQMMQENFALQQKNFATSIEKSQKVLEETLSVNRDQLATLKAIENVLLNKSSSSGSAANQTAANTAPTQSSKPNSLKPAPNPNGMNFQAPLNVKSTL